MTPETIEKLQIARQATQILVERFGPKVRRVILYGSVARGTAGPNSDVDLCIVVPTWQDVALEVTRHGMADYLRGEGIAVGSEAGQVHMSCFDEGYLRQNRFGIDAEFCRVTAGALEAINEGRVLHG